LLLVLAAASALGLFLWGQSGPKPFDGASSPIGMSIEGWASPNGPATGTRTTPFQPEIGEVIWRRAFTSAPFGLLADGEGVYAGLEDNRIVAFSHDGIERWSVLTPGELDVSPILAGGSLISVLRNGVIVAYDLVNGQVAWTTDSRHQQIAYPAVDRGVLWTSSLPELSAIDAATGRVLWQSQRGWDLRVAAVAVGGGNVVVGGLKNVFLIDPSTGEELFYLGVADALYVAATDTVVVAVSKRNAVAFEPDERRPWWERARPAWNWLHTYQMAPEPPVPPRRWVISLAARPLAPAMDDAHLYLADEGALRAYSLETGDLRWSIEAEFASAPIATPAGVLIGTPDGLSLVDAGSGELRAESPDLDSPPIGVAVTRDRTYVVTGSELVAFGANRAGSGGD
jgi:outer membrane protein assembly factor BamB